MKINAIPLFILTAVAVSACNDSGGDATQGSSLSTISLSDKSVNSELLAKLTSPNIATTFEKAGIKLAGQLATTHTIVTKKEAVTCERGRYKENTAVDDQGDASPIKTSMIYTDCVSHGETLNGSVEGVLTEGAETFSSVTTMDLHTRRESMSGTSNYSINATHEFTGSSTMRIKTKSYGTYQFNSTVTASNSTGEIIFANERISWVTAKNGIDVTLLSTGTTKNIDFSFDI